jgi:hypothetical protein
MRVIADAAVAAHGPVGWTAWGSAGNKGIAVTIVVTFEEGERSVRRDRLARQHGGQQQEGDHESVECWGEECELENRGRRGEEGKPGGESGGTATHFGRSLGTVAAFSLLEDQTRCLN